MEENSLSERKKTELLELLKHGVHFGHRTSRWHPKMEPYIFTMKNGVHIINLEQTLVKLQEAMDFIRQTVQKGGTILFVGTKRQARDIVERHAKACGMPYIPERWIGGLFTNFETIAKLQGKFQRMEEEFAKGEFAKYTKREQHKFQETMAKLNRLIGGVKTMARLPEAVYIVDIRHEKTAVREARKKGIPIAAMVDTNTNPELVDYPIPANDDAIKSIEYITAKIAQAVQEGRTSQAIIPHDEEKSASGKTATDSSIVQEAPLVS